MSTARADAKKRIVIRTAKPGEIFDIRRQDDDRYLLVRLQQPGTGPRMTREECLNAIARSPLNMEMSWDRLRRLTREA